LFIFTQTRQLQHYLQQQMAQNRTIGFVPTMGALHRGHLTLIENALNSCDITVCSIFVNPTQFNQQIDFDQYPRLPDQDTELLIKAGCNVLFMPDASQMYPDGLNRTPYNFGLLTHSLEGAFRPGHFDGVITIVKRLFELVQPHVAFFGQKDFQQCMVIKHLIHQFDLPVTLKVVATVREPDGLAMSSRNLRLSAEEREHARTLYKALIHVSNNIGRKPLAQLLHEATEIANTTLKTEYIALVNADTFEPITADGTVHNAVVLGAAWCGNVRLIDNVVLFQLMQF
jgi:pantoate--beta-alanine ligase